ncbi:hypothetical protein P8452_27362 [Trifolium repens]|nr:hypothetical protein P8452_27362 [Trifolium repens]
MRGCKGYICIVLHGKRSHGVSFVQAVFFEARNFLVLCELRSLKVYNLPVPKIPIPPHMTKYRRSNPFLLFVYSSA